MQQVDSEPIEEFGPETPLSFSCPPYSLDKSGLAEPFELELQDSKYPELKTKIEVTCVYELACNVQKEDVDALAANITAEPISLNARIDNGQIDFKSYASLFQKVQKFLKLDLPENENCKAFEVNLIAPKGSYLHQDSDSQ